MASKVQISKGEKSSPPANQEQAFHPFLALREQMDRIFDEFASDWRVPTRRRGLPSWEPFEFPTWSRGMVDVRFDLSETDSALELTAELPGIEEKDVELALSDGVLTVKGEKRAEKERKDKEVFVSERRYGSFARSMRLPETVDTNKIKATFEKGVLKIVAPKRAEAKAKRKRISISKV